MLSSSQYCTDSPNIAWITIADYSCRAHALFTTDPVLIVALLQPYVVATIFSTLVGGFVSTRFRTIREPLLVSFVIFTGGLVGMATVQPGRLAIAIGSSVLFGLGFGAPLILVVTGVQLSTPHKWIATATACTTSARAVAGAMFSTINATAFSTRLRKFLPSYVGKAALSAGLPAASIPAFIAALNEGDSADLMAIPGVDAIVIEEGLLALKQAYADSLRVVFIVAAPFGVVACVACYFLGDLSKTMNNHVDAPIERVHINSGHKKEAAV